MTLIPLGKTARFINGAAFKPTDWEDSGLPIIRIQNLTGTGEKFNRTTREVKQELIVAPGDLLVSWSATLDVYRWSGPRGVLNQHIFKVIPYQGVDQEYLFYALKSVLAELSAKTHGSTMKHVVRPDFEATRINVPTLHEQRRIATLLDRASEIRRKAEAARDKARAIIPALFLDTFGDPATNPKGWPMTTVGELLADASYGTSKKANGSGEGLPVIRMGNVEFDGSLSTTDLKYIDLEGVELANAELRSGDLLFNRTNSKELVGKTGLWDGRFDAVAASYFIRLRIPMMSAGHSD